MVNIKKFPRGILDQVISGVVSSSSALLARVHLVRASSNKLQASSGRPQAASIKPQASKPQASASSDKPQASSSLILDPRYMDIGEVLGVQALPCLLPSLLASVNLDKNSCKSCTLIIFLSAFLIVEFLH